MTFQVICRTQISLIFSKKKKKIQKNKISMPSATIFLNALMVICKYNYSKLSNSYDGQNDAISTLEWKHVVLF